jgi:hypothetical protein
MLGIDWNAVLQQLTGAAVIVVVLAFVGRSFFMHVLARDLNAQK